MYDLQKRIMVRSGRLGVPLQECKDGWTNFIALFDWDLLVDWLKSGGGCADLDDDKFKDIDYQIRPEVRQHISEVTDAFTKSHDKRWVCEEGQNRGVIAIPCNTAKDVVENPQLNIRNFFVDVNHKTPWRIKRRAPLIGEHNNEIYKKELGLTSKEMAALKGQGVI